MVDFKLPELGEGVQKGTVVKVLVAEGDRVQVDQPVLEIEVDKATVELPSPHAGKVTSVAVKDGDEVEVGQTVMTLEGGDGAEAPEKAESGKKGKKKKKSGKKAEAEEAEEEAAEEPEEDEGEEEAAEEDEGEEEAAEEDEGEEEEAEEPEEDEGEEEAAEEPTKREKPRRPAKKERADSGNGARPRREAAPARAREGEAPLPAGPAVRKLARHLELDLSQIQGTGERGRIRPEDVYAHVKGRMQGGGGPAGAPALPDFSQWGDVRREKISGVRRATVQAMSTAWRLIPHVTQHDLADVTELEAARKELSQQGKGPKITMTAIVLKAAVVALKAFPAFNASLDAAAEDLIYKSYYHLGVAVDTEHGLLVPVIRDVDRKSVLQLAAEVGEIADKARARKLGRDDLRGATFTITNLGGIGGTAFTPIVNWPEVAILGLSRARQEYVVTEQGPTPRLLMPLSLSYDHRVIDGAGAARFTRTIADLLSRPMRLLFEL